MLNLPVLLDALHGTKVEFIVVGGVAAWLNGSTMLTRDLDVCCRVTEANMSRLIEAIRPLNPKLRGDPRNLKLPEDPALLSRLNMLILRTDAGDFDLVPELPPIGRYDDLLPQSMEMMVEGHLTRVLTIDALIAVKKAVGRLKDKQAVMHLESAKKRREQTGQNP